MTTIPVVVPAAEPRVIHVARSLRAASPALWKASVLMLAMTFAASALSLVDARLLHGVSVWAKPAKFFLSLTVQFLTVAWALSLVPAVRGERGVRWAVFAMLAAAWTELAYIVLQAARGVASHFNQDTAWEAAAYGLMGLGAVIITATGAYVGWRVWRARDGMLWPMAAGLGLMLGAVLGTIFGMYLGAQTNHWVGGELSDANGLRFFGWSMTGGDLRVAHFVGLHAAQFVPLAALSGRRGVVCAVAGIVSVLTVLVFVQAVMGVSALNLTALRSNF